MNDEELETPSVKYTEEWIPVRDLQVDPRIQRDHLDMKKVDRFVRNFSEGALGVVTVSRRNAVTNVIIDGWHRREVVHRVKGDDGVILCHVYHDLTLAEEAQKFLELNDGNRPSVIDKFRVRITAGDEVATRINEIVSGYGWRISVGAKRGNIQCAGTLEKIYYRSVAAERDPNVLADAILVVTRAWDLDCDGVHASLLEGLALFLEEYRGAGLDLPDLINRLRTYAGGPAVLLSNSRHLAALRNGRTVMAVAEQLVETYNTGKKTKKLTAWRRSR